MQAESYLFGLCAFLILGLLGGMLMARSPRSALKLLGLAAVPEAAVAFTLGLHLQQPELIAIALLILGGKGLLAPRLIAHRLPPEMLTDYGIDASIKPLAAALLGMGITALCLRLASVTFQGPLAVSIGALLAAAFVALASPTFRHELWAQAAGLILAEGSVFSLGLILAAPLPVLSDLIGFVDLLVLAGALSVLIAAVAALHGRADARLLTRLRG